MNVVKVEKDLSDLIPGYLENRKTDISQLKTFLENNEWKEIERIGHKLAGNAGSYGFLELSEIGKKIEKAAIESNLHTAKEGLKEMIDYLSDLQVEYI